jgi:hypothetical protein
MSAGLGQWFSHEFSLDFEVCIGLGIVELALCNIETGRRDEMCCQVKCFCHSIEPSSSNGNPFCNHCASGILQSSPETPF